MQFIRNGFLALGAAAILSACATTPAEEAPVAPASAAMQAEPESEAQASPPELTAEQIWSFDAAGNATHIQSGLICPLSWGGFQRTNIHIFRTDGQDVGCNYEDGNDAIVTVYAYRSPLPVPTELKQIMEQVVKVRHPVYEDADFNNPARVGPTDNEFNYLADVISYRNSDGQAMKSGLALADYYGWRTKARLTYPEAGAEDLEFFVNIVMLGERDQLYERQKQEALPVAQDSGAEL